MRVEVYNTHARRRVAAATTARMVRGVLAAEGRTRGTVRVVFHGDRASRRLNAAWLRHDRVTDVISFLLDAGSGFDGEVYVNLDQARRQADRFGVRFGTEVGRLVAHGALHLAGYDDRTAAGRRRMTEREDAALARWDGRRMKGDR
jgi:rRNA maturation RNase YbeY